jgi:hypothetical protein
MRDMTVISSKIEIRCDTMRAYLHNFYSFRDAARNSLVPQMAHVICVQQSQLNQMFPLTHQCHSEYDVCPYNICPETFAHTTFAHGDIYPDNICQ